MRQEPIEGTTPREDDRRPGRPIPVRALMGISSPVEAQRAEEIERRIEIGEEQWIARTIGSTRSGSGSDPGSPLVLIAFSRAEDPDLPVREALAVGASLADLGDTELQALLSQAKPFRAEAPGGERPRAKGGRGAPDPW